MGQKDHTARATGRREFLSRLSGAAAASGVVLSRPARAGEQPDAAAPLPTIQLGPHRVTRLIAGWNPIGGLSYMGPNLDRHMKEYFTVQRTAEFLLNCERRGINAHQFSRPEEMAEVFRLLRRQGSKMKLICLHSAQRMPINDVVRQTSPVAIVHHGGITDRLFREGKSQQVHDFVKEVHDAGVLAGVSAHNPDVIKQVADEGWENDLFMTCFYYITRTPEAIEKLPPAVTVQVGKPFYAADPLRMTDVVRQVEQPCLGFKILAAGRNCFSKQSVREAFKFAFEHIKPTDGVIVGMYPRFHDEIADNAAYTREFSTLSRA